MFDEKWQRVGESVGALGIVGPDGGDSDEINPHVAEARTFAVAGYLQALLEDNKGNDIGICLELWPNRDNMRWLELSESDALVWRSESVPFGLRPSRITNAPRSSLNLMSVPREELPTSVERWRRRTYQLTFKETQMKTLNLNRITSFGTLLAQALRRFLGGDVRVGHDAQVVPYSRSSRAAVSSLIERAGKQIACERMPFALVISVMATLICPSAAYSTEIIERGCRAELPSTTSYAWFSEDGREVQTTLDYYITDKGDGGVVTVTVDGFFDISTVDGVVTKRLNKKNSFNINADRKSFGEIEVSGYTGGLCGARSYDTPTAAKGCSIPFEAISIERVTCRSN